MKNLCFFPAHCTLTPHLSLPRCIFRKNCTQPTITLWEVFLNNLESEVYTIIIRNSISWEFCLFSLIFLFNHLYQLGLTGSYFILWIVVQHCIILSFNLFFQVGFYVPLTFFFLSTSFFMSLLTCSRFISYVSSSVINHLSRFLLLETGIKNEDLGDRCAHCYWGIVSLRPSQLTEQGNICMHTNLCLYPHL